MLQNAYFVVKIGADTAENEQHFAEKLPKIGNYPSTRRGGPETGGVLFPSGSSLSLLPSLRFPSWKRLCDDGRSVT